MNKIAALILIAFMLIGCSTTYVNRNPVGENFPTVNGQTLTEEERELPTL
jgi:PBP1b-binding outer membrane lipoprotein LpoB